MSLEEFNEIWDKAYKAGHDAAIAEMSQPIIFKPTVEEKTKFEKHIEALQNAEPITCY